MGALLFEYGMEALAIEVRGDAIDSEGLEYEHSAEGATAGVVIGVLSLGGSIADRQLGHSFAFVLRQEDVAVADEALV